MKTKKERSKAQRFGYDPGIGPLRCSCERRCAWGPRGRGQRAEGMGIEVERQKRKVV